MEETSFDCAIMDLEEKKVNSEGDDEEANLAEINKEGDVNQVMHVKQEEIIRKRPASAMKDLTLNHEDQLRSTNAKIGEVKEENERLRQLLSKIKKDYQSLQKHFCEAVQEEAAKKTTEVINTHQENEEPELVCLSLGRIQPGESKKEEKKSVNLSDHGNEDNELNNKGLSLGLDIKFEPDSSVTMKINNNASPDHSFEEEPKENEHTETWPPSKDLKTTISADDEVLQQNQTKKTRVSIRTRCDTPTMNDGCPWRKYGQKIAKGNPCPRAYYRCTVSPTCPVRKQVQRCAEDMSILITTYEGTHNHPLPLSATAMASTTSAAASMLESRSSTSQSGIGTSSVIAPASVSNTPNGLNLCFSQNSRPQQFYFPNPSISTSSSHPTITLDLTAPSNSTTSHYFTNRFSASTPRCLNFSSSSSSSTSFNHSNINAPQSLWNPTYGTLPLNRNYVEKQPTLENHNFNQVYKQMMKNSQTQNQQPLTESIAAATKVIASNPTFRSALAAAITSFVGNNGGTNTNNPNVGDFHSGMNLKLDDHQSLAFNTRNSSSHSNGMRCASSCLNKSSTSLSLSSQQQGNLVSFPASLPFSASKSASETSANSRDHNKG